MNDSNNIFKIIEELNYEYLILAANNKVKVNKTKKTKNLLKKKDYQLIFQKSIKHLPILKNFYQYKLSKMKIINENYYFNDLDEKFEDKKIVVYTCITGNYDSIEDPYIKEDNVDYVIFSNQYIESNIWIVNNIPNSIMKLKDNSLINRYIKLHPHELFKNKYDYAIYIDGNIRIMSTIKDLPKCINSKTGIAFHKHSARDDVYNELIACKLIGRAKASSCNKQINNYKKMGVPNNLGLFECNAFILDLKNSNAEKIFEEWWKDFINEPTKRDQPSLMYSLWKNNFKSDDVGILGNNVYLNPKFRIKSHR